MTSSQIRITYEVLVTLTSYIWRKQPLGLEVGGPWFLKDTKLNILGIRLYLQRWTMGTDLMTSQAVLYSVITVRRIKFLIVITVRRIKFLINLNLHLVQLTLLFKENLKILHFLYIATNVTYQKQPAIENGYVTFFSSLQNI